MNLLSPWSLVWLGSIPLLLWLWRLASTKRQIRIASLVPFEHLLRRAPQGRARLVVTALFWLQLAALIVLALALARPVLLRPRANTILAILDTSASMGAKHRGTSAFDQAKRALLTRVARKSPADQMMVMTTSPVTPLTPQPTSDPVALTRAIEGLRVAALGGNLATTAHIGRALLTVDPDEMIVVTDEAEPARLDDQIEWITVGAPSANMAIVGLDTQGPLCRAADASVVATVQNFSGKTASATITASQRGRKLAEIRTDFDPQARRSVALSIPEETEGWVEISLRSRGDQLDVDNHAWVDIHGRALLPVVVQSRTPAVTQTVSTWLDACEALAWTTEPPSSGTSTVVITDSAQASLPTSGASLMFDLPSSPEPLLSYWVVSAGHPIGAYLNPVEVVAAAIHRSAETGSFGTPVVKALVQGRDIPILIADEREGRRRVVMRLDPSGSRESTPVLLAFLNSLRWLMGRSASQTTGEPLVVSGFAAGSVTVRRPDGITERIENRGGAVVYDRTTAAGLYRLSQGTVQETVAVNFLSPLESNLRERTSTWGVQHLQPTVSEQLARRVRHPLANLLIILILILLLAEWWRYSLKGRSTLA